MNAETKLNVTRRGFLAGTGAVTFALTFLPAPGARAQGAGMGGAVNAWVDIGTDGRVTIFAPAAEMGQGVQTSIPLLVAEEMDIDWDDVTVRTAPVRPELNNPIFNGQYTVASMSIRGYWIPARKAGAQVRRVLMQAASDEWGVALADVTTEPGVVIGPEGQRLTYGEIVETGIAAGPLPEIADDELKPMSEFRLLGHDVTRVDMQEKSTGAALYAADIRLPDMLYATVARSPVSGQVVEGFNSADVEALDGVTHVISLGHGIAVVGESIPKVFAARQALEVEWSQDAPGLSIDSGRDAQEYLERLRDGEPDVVFATKGDVETAMADAAEVFTREFVTEYLYHAQMEPMGAVAHVRDDGADVWVGTQWQTMAVNRTAAITGLDVAQVTLHQLYMGGGFGRRAHTEYVDDVVQIAMEVGRPVKLLLSREDDVASARMRPLTAQRVSMALDSDGRITGLRHAVACEPVSPYMYGAARWEADGGKDLITMRGSALPYYTVEHQEAVHYHEMRGARVAAYRGIGAGYTKFALETMVDQIAREHGHDPLQYRLDMAGSDRVRAVLNRVAEMAEYEREREDGRGIGLAFTEYGESITAVIAEISLDRETGRITVHHLWAAADAGLPLQPDNIRAQMEGGMTFGLSETLMEEMTLRDGIIQQSNYFDYEVIRMDETPTIEVDVLHVEEIPTQVGELGLPPIAPAIANAVHGMTGKALNHLPLSPQRVLAALET